MTILKTPPAARQIGLASRARAAGERDEEHADAEQDERQQEGEDVHRRGTLIHGRRGAGSGVRSAAARRARFQLP